MDKKRFYIKCEKSGGWYIVSYTKFPSFNTYLYTDGVAREYCGINNVYYKTREKAREALAEYRQQGKPVKPKLSKSNKKRVTDIVIKLKATLKNLEAALKEVVKCQKNNF